MSCRRPRARASKTKRRGARRLSSAILQAHPLTEGATLSASDLGLLSRLGCGVGPVHDFGLAAWNMGSHRLSHRSDALSHCLHGWSDSVPDALHRGADVLTQLWGIPTPAPPPTLAWMPFDGYSVSRYHKLHGLFNVLETHPRTPPTRRAPHADVLAGVLRRADPMALPRASQAATAAAQGCQCSHTAEGMTSSHTSPQTASWRPATAATLTATATRLARMRPTSQSAPGSSGLTPWTAAAGRARRYGRR